MIDQNSIDVSISFHSRIFLRTLFNSSDCTKFKARNPNAHNFS